MAAGDVTGDGRPDLVVRSQVDEHGWTTLLNDGGGGFGTVRQQTTGATFIFGLALGRLDGDPVADLVQARFTYPGTGGRITVGVGDGAGAFGPGGGSVGLGLSTAPKHIATGDFNGDGRQDVAFTTDFGRGYVLLGDGAGGISYRSFFDVGCDDVPLAIDCITGIETADVNRDGKLDLLTPLYRQGRVAVVLGDGTGLFGAATFVATGSASDSGKVAVGDLDGDGKLDLAVVGGPAPVVSLLHGDGGGGFSAPSAVPLGGLPASVAVSDLDGDGKGDLVIPIFGEDRVEILEHVASGGFGVPQPFATGDGPLRVAVADFDGDARPDIAVLDYLSDSVSILRNTTGSAPPPPPVLPSPQPPSASTEPGSSPESPSPGSASPLPLGASSRPPPAGPVAFATIPSQRLKARAGRVRVRIACRLRAGQACRGTVRLTSRRGRGAGSAILGAASFTIKGGATAGVSITLGRIGLNLLRGAARNSVYVRVAPRAGATGKPVQRTLTLTR